MSTYPQFIDNRRKNLAEVLRDIAPNYKTLRIATGYWDLPGTLEIINELQEYDLIELLIGQWVQKRCESGESSLDVCRKSNRCQHNAR